MSLSVEISEKEYVGRSSVKDASGAMDGTGQRLPVADGSAHIVRTPVQVSIVRIAGSIPGPTLEGNGMG